MTIKETFSKNFKRLMNLNNKSQKDISDALGYPSATISEWSRGAKYPRMDKIETLAKYFNVQISDLVEDKSSPILADNEKDVSKMFESLKARLNLPGITFEDKPITQQQVSTLISGIQITLEIAMRCGNNKK